MWESSSTSDQPADSSTRSCLEAATEAANRINALLVAKGVLKPSQISAAPAKAKVAVRLYCVLRFSIVTFSDLFLLSILVTWLLAKLFDVKFFWTV
jgi:hypothetical protein